MDSLQKMTPPIKDLLPRLTPILKNRQEKVQENCIDLVGRIADRGAEYVPAREWMRICFELLEMLKAHKKGIRRATVNTFGYIAKVRVERKTDRPPVCETHERQVPFFTNDVSVPPYPATPPWPMFSAH